MRGKKRYSNVTFTKRVDHDEGLRPARASEEPRVCEICNAVYADRRWTAPGKIRENLKHRDWRPAEYTVCPACEQQHGGVPRGFVHLEGAFLSAHGKQIEQLLRNEAARAAEDNPLARIMGWQQGEGGQLTVTTTTEHLAQRLGHALNKAFDGEVSYNFSHENKFGRVRWRRD